MTRRSLCFHQFQYKKNNWPQKNLSNNFYFLVCFVFLSWHDLNENHNYSKICIINCVLWVLAAFSWLKKYFYLFWYHILTWYFSSFCNSLQVLHNGLSQCCGSVSGFVLTPGSKIILKSNFSKFIDNNKKTKLFSTILII